MKADLKELQKLKGVGEVLSRRFAGSEGSTGASGGRCRWSSRPAPPAMRRRAL